MSRQKIILGKKGEDLAAEYLTRLGYEIRERNYRTIFGEIDLIALEKNVLVFIEIKTRRNHKFGRPQEAVNYTKQNRIYKSALYYLTAKDIRKQNCRFDIVAIDFTPIGNKIELLRDAFQVNAAWV